MIKKTIELTSEYITLGQLLKVADFISSGAEAKIMVKQLAIKVNGEKEDRRGRKLYADDIVEIEDQLIKIK